MDGAGYAMETRSRFLACPPRSNHPCLNLPSTGKSLAPKLTGARSISFQLLPSIFARRPGKQKTPSLGVLCGSSRVLEGRKDFVACLIPRSPSGPQLCSSRAWPDSRCTRKPRLLLTAPSPFRAIHRTKADGGLIPQPCHRRKPMNTNSHYSDLTISDSALRHNKEKRIRLRIP